MALLVKINVALDPLQIALFSADTVMLEAQPLPDQFQELWFLFHGAPPCA